MNDGVAAHRLRREAVSYARTVLGSRLDLDAFEVVLGELLSNVVQHAAGTTTVCVDVGLDNVELSVSDDGRGFRLCGEPHMPDAAIETGRGLAIVRAMSSGINVQRRHERGALIRVSLPLDARRSDMKKAG